MSRRAGRQEGHEGRFGPAHDGVIELAQVGHVVESPSPAPRNEVATAKKENASNMRRMKLLSIPEPAAPDEVPDIAARGDDGLELPREMIPSAATIQAT